MAATYEPIATTTVSGTSTTSVTFNSFSGYTDLIAVVNAGWNSGSDYQAFLLNGDTVWTSSYSSTWLDGDGSSARSGRYTNNGYGLMVPDPYDTTLNNHTILHFMNYANTTTYKTILARNNNGLSGTSVSLYRSTSAITSINFRGISSTAWKAGSTFTLYGIKAA